MSSAIDPEFISSEIMRGVEALLGLSGGAANSSALPLEADSIRPGSVNWKVSDPRGMVSGFLVSAVSSETPSKVSSMCSGSDPSASLASSLAPDGELLQGGVLISMLFLHLSRGMEYLRALKGPWRRRSRRRVAN